MYSVKVPYKNYKKQPQTREVYLHLEMRELYKLSPEFDLIFNWRDEMQGDPRNLDPQEVIPYFTAFEEILLSAYGVPTADGEEFDKTERYKFEQSACFNALLMQFVTDPAQVLEFLKQIVPEGAEDMVKKQAENIKKMEESGGQLPEAASATPQQSPSEMQEEIDRLRAKVATQNQPSQPDGSDNA